MSRAYCVALGIRSNLRGEQDSDCGSSLCLLQTPNEVSSMCTIHYLLQNHRTTTQMFPLFRHGLVNWNRALHELRGIFFFSIIVLTIASTLSYSSLEASHCGFPPLLRQQNQIEMAWNKINSRNNICRPVPFADTFLRCLWYRNNRIKLTEGRRVSRTMRYY